MQDSYMADFIYTHIHVHTYIHYHNSSLLCVLVLINDQQDLQPKVDSEQQVFFHQTVYVRYKRQDRENNGISKRIQSVLCEDTLSAKRIIVIWRSLLYRSVEELSVYTVERKIRITIKVNSCFLSQIVKGSTWNCVNNKELI